MSHSSELIISTEWEKRVFYSTSLNTAQPGIARDLDKFGVIYKWTLCLGCGALIRISQVWRVSEPGEPLFYVRVA